MSLAGLLVTPTLRAEAAAITVQYTAPIECPSEREFLLDVHARNPRIADKPAYDDPQLFVTIEKRESLYAGKLERSTTSGTVGVREISGNTCAEVSAALALITALTADLAPFPTELRSPAAANSEPSVPPASADQPSAEGSPRGTSNATPWLGLQFGVGGTLVSGVTPHPFVAGTVFAQASVRTSSIWAPSLRVSGSFGGSS
jgi:hypothetical protein